MRLYRGLRRVKPAPGKVNVAGFFRMAD